jgi:hypothetical protein
MLGALTIVVPGIVGVVRCAMDELRIKFFSSVVSRRRDFFEADKIGFATSCDARLAHARLHSRSITSTRVVMDRRVNGRVASEEIVQCLRTVADDREARISIARISAALMERPAVTTNLHCCQRVRESLASL